MDQVLRIGLPIYFAVFFGVAFFWRSYVVWKETGINPYVLGKSDSAYDFLGFAYRLSLAMNFVVIVFYSFVPQYYEYIAPFRWLEVFPLQIFGLILIFATLVWIAIAQKQMGASWRVGIDKENDTALVNKGLFTVSRNPIFFGMRIAVVGFFLAIPNALTFCSMVLSDMLMQIQVRLEEEHLEKLHGERYLEYKRSVRRWI